MSDLTQQQYATQVSTARKWMEHVLGRALPKLADFEASLSSGVSLCLLGKKCAPELNAVWSDIYDGDEEQFKRSGPDEGHGRNLRLYATFLERIGLPKCFCLSEEDLSSKVQLVSSVHALSYFLKTTTVVDKTVQDFAHRAEANEVKYFKRRMQEDKAAVALPSFDALEDRLQEELQHTSCVGRFPVSCPDFTDSRRNISNCAAMVTSRSSSQSLFDDPIYEGYPVQDSTQFPNKVSPERVVAELPCQQDGITAKVYENPLPSPEPSLREGALYVIHVALSNNSEEVLLSALSDPNAGLPHVRKSDNARRMYMSALLKEKAKRTPRAILCVYQGLSKEECEKYLERLTPGAFLVREEKDTEEHYIFSFRNQTTTEHWKIHLEDGKYQWGEDQWFVTLRDWVAHFAASQEKGAGCEVHQGSLTQLQITRWEDVPRLVEIADSENALTHEQIEETIKAVNAKLLRQRKSSADVRRQSMAYFYWNKDMLVHVSRKTAEQLLKEFGSPGAFIVRPSSQKDNFAISFRTEEETIHWKVVPVNGKLTVYPRPHQYDTLQEVVMSFAETISEKTGLLMRMLPLPDKVKAELCLNGRNGEFHKSESPKHLLSPTGVTSILNPHNVSSWSTQDVAQWLKEVHLEEFVQCFSSNEVDGECLLSLDHAQMKDDLGIFPLGRRHRILKEIKKLTFVTVQV